ncbi:hypothetical protein CVT24_007284 [Panaeolus cyanescens]|uniref:Uncharacterized protein n=1 Tax=Panaeolus cyanescens TaxID=181874 RepID=A0A409VJ63_9AGAR|nr:hypothetical protein CVT24_007284 [Panaeolus cyanescens]
MPSRSSLWNTLSFRHAMTNSGNAIRFAPKANIDSGTANTRALFNPNITIPDVVPDSDPGSPFHNAAFTGFTKRPISKIMPHRAASPSMSPSPPLIESDGANSAAGSLSDNSDDMGSDWESFKHAYEDRRRQAAANCTTPTGKSPKRSRKLAKFIEEMDRKYPYNSR